MARLSNRSYEQLRVVILEFLDTDVFHVSVENCVSFLDPLIERWDIDLETFSVEIALNRRLTLERLKRFEFVEKEPEPPDAIEPGLEEFLADTSISGDATEEEIKFLKSEVQRKMADSPLLLPRTAKSQRSSSFPRSATRKGMPGRS